jgi:hypothetical protein
VLPSPEERKSVFPVCRPAVAPFTGQALGGPFAHLLRGAVVEGREVRSFGPRSGRLVFRLPRFWCTLRVYRAFREQRSWLCAALI